MGEVWGRGSWAYKRVAGRMEEERSYRGASEYVQPGGGVMGLPMSDKSRGWVQQ